MKLTSSEFKHEKLIPTKYTCDGENISPPIKMSEIPDGAESLVLIMEDPDVPKELREDGMWDHWLVWDILPEEGEIPEDMNPPGIMGNNTGNRLGYGGPCPPDKEHRYFFKLYALDTMLDLPQNSSKADILAGMEGHIIEQCELMGRYNRQEN